MRYQLQNYVVDFIYIDTNNVWFLIILQIFQSFAYRN